MSIDNSSGQLHCCTRCQIYWTCDTKWYRGEKQEDNLCCPRCDYYTLCAKQNGLSGSGTIS